MFHPDVSHTLDFSFRLAAKIRDSTTEEMRPITQSHVDHCRERCENVNDSVVDSDENTYTDVECNMDHLSDGTNVSTLNKEIRSGLRFILSHLFSIFGISKNFFIHVRLTHILIIIPVMSLYVLYVTLKRSSFGQSTKDTVVIATHSSFELLELSNQLKILTEEMKQLRLSLK